MKKLFLVMLFVGCFCGNVLAQPFTPTMGSDSYGTAQGGGNIAGVATPNDKNDGVPDISDAINQLLGQGLPHNSDYDNLQVTSGDIFWNDLGGGDNTGTFVLIGLTASHTNTLEVYDVNTPATKFSVLGPVSGFGFSGDGSAFDPYPAGFSPLASGTNFGYSLLSSGDRFDSDPTKNPLGLDHMLTYNLSGLAGQKVFIEHTCDLNGDNCTVEQYTFNNPFLLGWEDLQHNGTVLGDEDFDDTIFLVDGVKSNVIPEPTTLALLASGCIGMIFKRKKQ